MVKLDREACLQLIRSSRTVAMVEEAQSRVRHLLPLDVFVSNLLVQRYGRCGSVEHARKIFDGIPEKNSFSWISLLEAYAGNGHVDEAAGIFWGMPEWNSMACTVMIVGYARNGHLEKAKSVFWSAERRDLALWNAFLGVLVDLGQEQNLLQALKLFGTVPGRDLITWTILLVAYARAGHFQKTRKLFESMPEWDLVSCTAMLSAYEECDDFRNAIFVFESMQERDIVSFSALLAVYARAGHLEPALQLYNSMPELNLISCSTILDIYSKNLLVDQARELFHSMPEHNLISRTSMFCAFALGDQLERAKIEFDSMPEWNSVSITALISLFARSGQTSSLKPFLDTSGVTIDAVASTALLIGHVQDGHLEAAKSVFDSIPASDTVARTSMLSSFAALGNIRGGERLFASTPDCDDSVLWNAMLAAYAQNGHSTEALELFFAMVSIGLELPPDGALASFLSILLACSHLGSVRSGRSCFVSMRSDFGLDPTKQHYNCFVDLLCRTGFTAEARDLIDSMPFDYDGVEWKSYLRSSDNVNDDADTKVAGIAQRSSGVYILLSNIRRNNRQKVIM